MADERKRVDLFLALARGSALFDVLRQDRDNYQKLRQEIEGTGFSLRQFRRGQLNPHENENFFGATTVSDAVRYAHYREKSLGQKSIVSEYVDTAEGVLKKASEKAEKIEKELRQK